MTQTNGFFHSFSRCATHMTYTNLKHNFYLLWSISKDENSRLSIRRENFRLKFVDQWGSIHSLGLVVQIQRLSSIVSSYYFHSFFESIIFSLHWLLAVSFVSIFSSSAQFYSITLKCQIWFLSSYRNASGAWFQFLLSANL